MENLTVKKNKAADSKRAYTFDMGGQLASPVHKNKVQILATALGYILLVSVLLAIVTTPFIVIGKVTMTTPAVSNAIAKIEGTADAPANTNIAISSTNTEKELINFAAPRLASQG